jgi:hypothetical protein
MAWLFHTLEEAIAVRKRLKALPDAKITVDKAKHR